MKECAGYPDGAVLDYSEGSADYGDIGAGEIAGIFQLVGVECGAGCGLGQIGGYASGFRVGPADNGGYAFLDAGFVLFRSPVIGVAGACGAVCRGLCAGGCRTVLFLNQDAPGRCGLDRSFPELRQRVRECHGGEAQRPSFYGCGAIGLEGLEYCFLAAHVVDACFTVKLLFPGIPGSVLAGRGRGGQLFFPDLFECAGGEFRQLFSLRAVLP